MTTVAQPGEKVSEVPAPSAAPLAPPTKETFDDLAKRVARTEPRRGSIVQPPPAWEPDEVTLGFAIVTESTGQSRELPESTLLATILIAVEADRRGFLNRMAASFEEEVDAVASLFWPFLVHHGGPDGRVAIFDGTGVWKRTFRYTRMPSMDAIRPLLEPATAPADYLARMRALSSHFAQDAGAEVLTVEGFLPVDPPLLYDVLTQGRFRSDPQSPHAGFLPARHKMDWYDEEVARMRRWLDRFEGDLRFLGDTRSQIEKIVKAAQTNLEAEIHHQQDEAAKRVQDAVERADKEIAQLQRHHHVEIGTHLEQIRKAHGAIAHGQASISTADTLAFRATHRHADPGPHQARARQAQNSVRAATRQIGESRRAIEKIHEQQRTAQEAVLTKVADVERSNALALAERELFLDEFAATANDLLQSIDGQMAARSTQRNVLDGYFLPFPSLASVRVVWLPLWMASLRSPRGVRQLVFPPMQVKSGIGLGGSLKRLLGGIVLPLEARTAQFDKVLRPTIEESIVRDPWLAGATQELTRAADVLVDPDVLVRLQEGLGELLREGWITRKQEEEFFRVYVDRSRRRPTGAGPLPVPVGARTERLVVPEDKEGASPKDSPR